MHYMPDLDRRRPIRSGLKKQSESLLIRGMVDRADRPEMDKGPAPSKDSYRQPYFIYRGRQRYPFLETQRSKTFLHQCDR